MCNRASIRKYKAYWHINFSLINGYDTVKIIFVVILSFEVVLVNSPNITIVAKKVNKKCKEKFVILQSIGIIAIKSSETRSVFNNCRYSSRHVKSPMMIRHY